MEPLELAVVMLSHKKAAQNIVKMSMSKKEVIEVFASRKLAKNSAKNFAMENKPNRNACQKKMPFKTVARNTVKNAIQKQRMQCLSKNYRAKMLPETVPEKLSRLQGVSNFSSNILRFKNIPRNSAKKMLAIKQRI